MDSSNSVVVSSKRLKSSEGEDMISNLPDFLIGRILSLVPIQDAVRTCVLSKRWKYLWTFVTDLLFQDRTCNAECELHHRRYSLPFFLRHGHLCKFKGKEKLSFINLVNGVMLCLNDSTFHSLSLIISDIYDPSLVNEWISSALHRRVKKLCVYSYEKLTMPSYSLLQFLSLEELVLMVGSCVVRVPNYVCFRLLTVLKLSQITLTMDSSNNSEDLTLEFPVLKEYVTVMCSWLGVESLTLEAPLLQEVSILSRCGKFPRIKFCVSHLTKFSFAGYVLPYPWFLDLSAANIASVYVRLFSHDLDNGEEVKNQACKLLKQFTSNAECLRFHWLQTKVVEQAKDSLADLPASKMLSRLKLDSVTIEILLGLLLGASVLKTLIICKELFPFDKEFLNSATVPGCFRSNFKMVELGCFDGSEHEMSFAKFVMENAQVLERIIFHIDRSMCHSKMEEVKEKLFSFKKASSTAFIEFV